MGFVGVTVSSLLVSGAALTLREAPAPLAPPAPSECSARIGLPANEAAVRQLGQRLEGFRRHESERFVLLTDSSADGALRTLATLERTAACAERFAADMGCVSRPLRERLTVVGFEGREAFERFAASVDRIDATWMTGYWAPGADRVVFRQGGTSLASAARRRGVYATTDAQGSATVAHEAGHQLLHRLGVQRRSPGAPLWVSEGMAIGFEPCASGAASAFAPQPDRSARVRQAVEAREAFGVAALVAMTAVPSADQARITAFYDQSWSLARWLATTRAHQFSRYLGLLREHAGSTNVRTNAALFEQAFGPAESVDAAWRAAVARGDA